MWVLEVKNIPFGIPFNRLSKCYMLLSMLESVQSYTTRDVDGLSPLYCDQQPGNRAITRTLAQKIPILASKSPRSCFDQAIPSKWVFPTACSTPFLGRWPFKCLVGWWLLSGIKLDGVKRNGLKVMLPSDQHCRDGTVHPEWEKWTGQQYFLTINKNSSYFDLCTHNGQKCSFVKIFLESHYFRNKSWLTSNETTAKEQKKKDKKNTASVHNLY